MAPTICLSELSVQNNNDSDSYVKRRRCSSDDNQNARRNSNGIVIKEQQLRRIFNNRENTELVDSLSPPASPVWQPIYPTRSSTLSTSHSNPNYFTTKSDNIACSQRWRISLARREGLLNIVARTMELVRRSHMLQKRVNALRYETREFINSVLNNPENNVAGRQHFVGLGVNSSSEALLSARPMTPPPTPDSSTEMIMEVSDDEQKLSDSNQSSCDKLDNFYPEFYFDEMERSKSRKLTQDPNVSSS